MNRQAMKITRLPRTRFVDRVDQAIKGSEVTARIQNLLF